MKMNVKGNDNFRTPDHIFKQLDDIFNFWKTQLKNKELLN